MITRERIDLARLVPHIGWPLLILLVYDAVVTLLYQWGIAPWVSVQDLPLPLMGSAIALILTLRNNAAYGRWWEARTLWGAVVNNSRSFARSLLALVDDEGERVRLVRQQVAYATALRCHLLRAPPWEEIGRYLDPDTIAALRKVANVPAGIQMAMAARIAALRRAGTIDTIGVSALESVLADLANAQGGLERIKNTPMPRQYNQFPDLLTKVYCLLLPLGLVADLGYATPLGSTVIGFTFLALDRIGHDLESPFEGTFHDVPMRAIARGIEIDLLHAIGESATPPPLLPEDGVLW